ncbi:MAG: GspH/FimT family pseudopilin [Arenimonas sp.]|nr:GspH/FimT family pseudopilin [Arenimonas sp.]MBP6626596.1 GspH/FimT family pseudopilin [Arenimonas sp.]
MVRNARKPPSAAGFTLIELAITVSILAITLAIALPSFTGLIRSNRVSTQTNAMMASLAYARSEAIRSNTSVMGNRDVVLCPSSDGATCSAAWGDGWIVARRVDDAVVTVLRHTQQPEGVVFGGAATEIVFDNRGRRLSGPDQITVQPYVCAAGDPYLRTLLLNAAGQARIVQGTCS